MESSWAGFDQRQSYSVQPHPTGHHLAMASTKKSRTKLQKLIVRQRRTLHQPEYSDGVSIENDVDDGDGPENLVDASHDNRMQSDGCHHLYNQGPASLPTLEDQSKSNNSSSLPELRFLLEGERVDSFRLKSEPSTNRFVSTFQRFPSVGHLIQICESRDEATLGLKFRSRTLLNFDDPIKTKSRHSVRSNSPGIRAQFTPGALSSLPSSSSSSFPSPFKGFRGALKPPPPPPSLRSPPPPTTSQPRCASVSVQPEVGNHQVLHPRCSWGSEQSDSDYRARKRRGSFRPSPVHAQFRSHAHKCAPQAPTLDERKTHDDIDDDHEEEGEMEKDFGERRPLRQLRQRRSEERRPGITEFHKTSPVPFSRNEALLSDESAFEDSDNHLNSSEDGQWGESGESSSQLVYRSSVRIMVRSERSSAQTASGHPRSCSAERAVYDVAEKVANKVRKESIGVLHRTIVKEQFRLPGDLMEKMPSATNSPMLFRKSPSRGKSPYEDRPSMSPSEEIIDSDEKGGEPGKMTHQMSVASMVQRFERDTSVDRARTRGASHSNSQEVLKRWPPSPKTTQEIVVIPPNESEKGDDIAEEDKVSTSVVAGVTPTSVAPSPARKPMASKISNNALNSSVIKPKKMSSVTPSSSSTSSVKASPKTGVAPSTASPQVSSSSSNATSTINTSSSPSSSSVKRPTTTSRTSSNQSQTKSDSHHQSSSPPSRPSSTTGLAQVSSPTSSLASSSSSPPPSSSSLSPSSVVARAKSALKASSDALPATSKTEGKVGAGTATSKTTRSQSLNIEKNPLGKSALQKPTTSSISESSCASGSGSGGTKLKSSTSLASSSASKKSSSSVAVKPHPNRVSRNSTSGSGPILSNTIHSNSSPAGQTFMATAGVPVITTSNLANKGTSDFGNASVSPQQNPQQQQTSGSKNALPTSIQSSASKKKKSAAGAPSATTSSTKTTGPIGGNNGPGMVASSNLEKKKVNSSLQKQSSKPDQVSGSTGERTKKIDLVKGVAVPEKGKPITANTTTTKVPSQNRSNPKASSQLRLVLELGGDGDEKSKSIDNVSTIVNVSSCSSLSPSSSATGSISASEEPPLEVGSAAASAKPSARVVSGIPKNREPVGGLTERDDEIGGESPNVSEDEHDQDREDERRDRLKRMDQSLIVPSQASDRALSNLGKVNKRSESDGIVLAERPKPDKTVRRCESIDDAGASVSAATAAAALDTPIFPQNIKTVSSATIVKGPEDATVSLGQTAHLNAHYFGNPEPRVTWLKNGSRIYPDDDRILIKTYSGESTLIVRDLRADDSGKYEVLIENEVGNDAAVASVGVEGPPEPPAGRPFLSDVDFANSSLTLAWYGCTFDGGSIVTGYLVEKSHWLIGQRPDTPEWVMLTSNCNSTSFRVKGLDQDKEYIFRVRAQNVYGQSSPGRASEPFSFIQPPSGGERPSSGSGTNASNNEETEDLDNDPFDAPFQHRIVSLETGSTFKTKYEIYEELGRGRFGVVFKVKDKDTNEYFAAKFVRCRKQEEKQKVRDEIDIMNGLEHPRLLQLAAAYENPKEIIMAMEYIGGGELFEKVVADDFTLTERDCMLFMRQICAAIGYMHAKDIVHLDLKPENILCKSKKSHQIKIIDFGLTRKIKPDEDVRILFGTPEFVSPEVINYEPVTATSDMWSVGVVCYVLLSGLSPFMGDSDVETFTNITSIAYDFDDEAFDPISDDAKDFIRKLLIKNQRKRMSAEDCLNHKWLALAEHTSKQNFKEINTDKLKSFLMRRRWQKAAHAIRALGRFTSLGFRHDSKDSASSIISTQSAAF